MNVDVRLDNIQKEFDVCLEKQTTAYKSLSQLISAAKILAKSLLDKVVAAIQKEIGESLVKGLCCKPVDLMGDLQRYVILFIYLFIYFI
jgi:hypothetical protein